MVHSHRLVVLVTLAGLAMAWAGLAGWAARAGGQEQGCRFRGEEIDRSLQVGYAVLLADLNGDAKKDIVVVDTTRVLWFENPTWKKRVLLQGQTMPDNVCIDAHDIDGDGQLDLALGAGWGLSNTKTGGTLQWLRRGPTLDDPWTLYPIGSEPSVHRLRFADLNGDGRPELIVAPLMGRGATAKNNWSEAPARLLSFALPPDPVRGPWRPDVIDDSLHVVHNFVAADLDGDGRPELLTASYEGVTLLARNPASGGWSRRLLGTGNQDRPQSNRGASEIKLGRLQGGRPFLATIEPWHGHQVVVYTPAESPAAPWRRQVLDEELKWGHAVWCADLDRDGAEELIIGVRDALNDQVRSGVRIYRARDAGGTSWSKQVLDPGGVAVEDLAAADLNGDGRIDLVAVGRATRNVKIYWNEP